MPKKTLTAYVVGHNMLGYMPDEDPYLVSTKRYAIGCSRRDALDYVEAWQPRARMTGARGEYVVDTDPEDPRAHTVRFWIEPVVLESDESAGRERCGICDQWISPGERYYQGDGWSLCLECVQ